MLINGTLSMQVLLHGPRIVSYDDQVHKPVLLLATLNIRKHGGGVFKDNGR